MSRTFQKCLNHCPKKAGYLRVSLLFSTCFVCGLEATDLVLPKIKVTNPVYAKPDHAFSDAVCAVFPVLPETSVPGINQ